MAHSFQASTLSLTLPISCQICLGKVRQPVICANYHVFCSTCMETWLKKASQCPTCRVPITAENPCREIIGGSNEGEHSESHSRRKHLRKTRGELLLREYEDEIDGLLKENEELRSEVQRADALPSMPLDPGIGPAARLELQGPDSHVLLELSSKLRAATEVCSKVQQDMERLKEANKTLRSQNVDLVQENMRLKAEVASRSPQKFGRYTVAALEAKIHQYERDMDHLKRALERSDQYIEDLESRLGRPPDLQGASGSEDPIGQQKIDMMRRSLSDTERDSICSNPEGQAVSGGPSLIFTASSDVADHREFEKLLRPERGKDATPSQLLPATPSSAFRSLTLKSPGLGVKKVAFKPGSYLRRLSFEDLPCPADGNSNVLQTENPFSNCSKFSKGLPPSNPTETSKSTFWAAWQGSKSNDPPGFRPITEEAQMAAEAASADIPDFGPEGFCISSEASMDAAYLDKISELDSMMLDGESSSSQGSRFSITSSDLATLIPGPTATCSDLSSSCGRGGGGSEQSSHLGNQPPCDMVEDVLDTQSKAGTAGDRAAMLGSGCRDGAQDRAAMLGSGSRDGAQDRAVMLGSGSGDGAQDRAAMLGSDGRGGAQDRAAMLGSDSRGGAQDRAAMLASGSRDGAQDRAAMLGSDSRGGAQVLSSAELSFDLLFDPSLVYTAGDSGCDSPQTLPHGRPSSPCRPGNTRDSQEACVTQPTKRKSQSPFNSNSPTKLSKLM